MSEEETSYSLKIEDEIGGLDSAIDKLGDAEKLLPKVSDELKALGSSMRRGSDESEKLGRAHGKHGKEVEHLEGAFQRLVHKGMEPFLERAKNIAEFEFVRRGVDALIDAPLEIAEKVKELGEEIILTAAKAERLDQSFKLTLGQEGAEEVLGWIEKIASKTEFTDDQLKGWSSELLRAGVKMADVDAFLAAGLDTAAKSTNKLEGMSGAISALSRAQLTGRVEGRALRGLSIGVDELKTLPEFQGLNDTQLHKKMEEGSISKDDLLTLIAGKDGVLGDLGLVAGKTFEAQLKNVKEIPDQIYQGLYKTAGFQKLGGFLTGIYESFGPDTEVGKGVEERLGEALDYVASKLQTIDLDDVAHKVGDALADLPAALETTKDMFNDLTTVVGILGDDIQGISKFFDFFVDKDKERKEGNKEFSRSRDPVEVRFEAEQRAKLYAKREAHDMGIEYVDTDRVFGPQEDALTRARKRKDEIRKELRGEGKLAGDGLRMGADDSNNKIAAAGAGMGDALKAGTNASLEVHSPSRALFRSGAFAGDGFVLGIESKRAAVEDAMETAFAMPAARPGSAAQGPGQISVTVDLSGMNLVTPPGADVHEVGDIIADKIRGLLPSVLANAFDGVRAESGS